MTGGFDLEAGNHFVNLFVYLLVVFSKCPSSKRCVQNEVWK